MQIESLKVFCDLVESESFTKTAQINNVTQSAVSQTISTLEQRFKSLLIERSKKNFRLTPEGEVLYDYSKRILQTHEALQNTMQDLKQVVSGDIRMATIYSIGLHALPPCLKQFLKGNPNVRVHLQYRHADQVYEDVLGNIVDLGLVAYPARDAGVEIVHLRKDPQVLICAPGHPLARSKSVRVKALDGQKFVCFQKDIPTQKALDRIFKTAGVKVRPMMTFDNVETVKRAVEIDAGVAIVPENTIRLEVSNQTLVAIRLEGADFGRPLGLLYKKGKVLSPAMKQFVALLKESL